MIDQTQQKITISFDFECGWGAIYSGKWREREQAGVYKTLRPIFTKLIAEMDAMEIPATWATVAALLDQPTQDELASLPQVERTAITDFCSNSQWQTRRGDDLLDTLVRSHGRHELASHSYLHLDFASSRISEDGKKRDVLKSHQILQQSWINPVSTLIFPFNRFPSETILEATKFTRIRVEPPQGSKKSNKILRTIDRLVRTPPISVESASYNMLQSQSASLYFIYPYTPNNKTLMKTRRFILNRQIQMCLHAIRNGKGNFHFWLHPYNLAENPWLLSDFYHFLSKVGKLQDIGLLKVDTMYERSLNLLQ